MNKHGWGLRAELAFVLLFVICILVSTILLHRMGIFGRRDEVLDPINYTREKDFDFVSLEKTVSDAAKRYYNDLYYNNMDTVIVSVDTLKNKGYMTSIFDNRNRECKGYSMIVNGGNAVSYIRCSTYKTTGYREEYE